MVHMFDILRENIFKTGNMGQRSQGYSQSVTDDVCDKEYSFNPRFEEDTSLTQHVVLLEGHADCGHFWSRQLLSREDTRQRCEEMGGHNTELRM